MGGIDTGTKRLRAYQRRAAANRREHRDREVGSSDAASPCRVIDRATGAAIGAFAPIKIEVPAGRLTFDTTPPTARLSKCKDAERRHRGCVRHHMGDRRELDGQDGRRAAGSPVNLSTLRSRKAREIAKLNRRDPLSCHRVRLPKSTLDEIILRFKPARPEDRDREIPEEAWDDTISRTLRQIIESVVKHKTPTR